MIRHSTAFAGATAALMLAGSAAAQPAGITQEMILRQLPEEGAPLAVVGPYAVVSERVSERTRAFRPADLAALSAGAALPVVAWGNGGCVANPERFAGFLETIASHGFLVVTTAGPEEPRTRATAQDLLAGVDWAFAENERAGAPLAGRIDVAHVAMMGVSCGGMLALSNAADPRIDTIGVWNSGARPPAAGEPAGGMPTTEALAALRGPTLYINGHEPDFMWQVSEANFEAIDHVPVFYGARHDAGHNGTYYHPGGGEFANVAVDWLKWTLKGDTAAGATFTGKTCGLCANPNWDVRRKGL